MNLKIGENTAKFMNIRPCGAILTMGAADGRVWAELLYPWRECGPRAYGETHQEALDKMEQSIPPQTKEQP